MPRANRRRSDGTIEFPAIDAVERVPVMWKSSQGVGIFPGRLQTRGVRFDDEITEIRHQASQGRLNRTKPVFIRRGTRPALLT